MLFRPSERFRKKVKSSATTPAMRRRIYRALERLVLNPFQKSVNLEPFEGRPGFYTARITKGWRFLLREREPTDQSRVFDIVDFGTHDDTYGR